MNDDDIYRVPISVVVDAGHGGTDPGATSGNFKEKDFNLTAANYIYNRLKELGIPTSITRSTDETISREERINRIMNAFGNTKDVILVSNHINAGGGEGAEVVYALRSNDNLARNVLEEIGKEGQIMRKYYQRRLPADTSKDYYYILRDTGNLTPILVEYGFIDNPNDLKKLQNNLLNYAEAVVRGITKTYNLTYTPPKGSENTYVVKAGDSLYSIARQFNTTVDEIKVLNNLTTNMLQIGQILKIPSITPPPPTPEEYIVYTVQKGDSLYKIANQYNTTVNEIVTFNQLATTLLSIGQQLLIPTGEVPLPPTPPPVTKTYTVQKGDSLWKIAQSFNVTVDELIKANNLTNIALQIDQVLNIPVKGEVPIEEENGQEPETPSNIQYVVQSGDSLYSIAKKYGITVDQIKALNNLSSNLLFIGQRLLIPSTEGYQTYYVKSGDNLYDLAIEFNTTVSELKSVNNLTTNNLKIGQVLIIPK